MAWFFARRRTAGIRKFRRSVLAAEALEGRRLLSISPDPLGNIVNVDWNGRSIEAIRDSYVVQMPQTNAATARGRWDYQSQVPAVAAGWSTRSLGYGFYAVDAPGSSVQQVNAWSVASGVMLASPNAVYRKAAVKPIPANDPSYLNGSLWGLNNIGRNGGKADADIDAPEAWEIAVGSRSVVVAVLDEGIDYTHPDLEDNMWRRPASIPEAVVGLHGFDDGNGDGDVKPLVGDTHGTHVAGTIGAKGNNALGITGVAWNVALYSAKVFPDGGGGASAESMVSALNRIRTLKSQFGVNFVAVNASLGYYGPPNLLEAAAIQGLANEDVLFVASAGNDDVNTDLPINDHYPSNYDIPNVISVGASTRLDTLADFSNYGTFTVDLAAPGVDILSTVPVGNNQPARTYDLLSGTSMASPHVTGVAVLLASKYRGLTQEWPTAEFLREAILKGADVVESLTHVVGGVEHRVAGNRRLNARGSLDWMLDNMPPAVTVANTRVLEGDDPSSPAFLLFEATINRPLDRHFVFTFSTEDWEAIAGRDYVAVSKNPVTIPAGERSGTFRVQVVGDTVFERNERLRVRLDKVRGAGGNAWLTRRVVVGTILNDDGDDMNPVAAIEPAKTIDESKRDDQFVSVTFPLLADGVAKRPVTISYAIRPLPAGHDLFPSAAKPITDFLAKQGTITIPAGHSSGRIPLHIFDNDLPQGDRHFLVELTRASPGSLHQARLISVVTIRDKEQSGPTTVSVLAETPSILEGNDRQMRMATFRVELDKPAVRDVFIRYTTVDGTARAGSDYVAKSGTVVIRAGQSSASIDVQILGDTIEERDETFFLRIISWVGLPARPLPLPPPPGSSPLKVEPIQAEFTIMNDDLPAFA